MSMISASKVGWDLAKISSEGGKIFNIYLLYRILFNRLPMLIPIFGRCGYSTDQLVFQKSPAGGAIFMLSADFL